MLHDCFTAPPIWMQWSDWSDCDTTCNSSFRQRTRGCTQQQLEYDIDCDGLAVDQKKCIVPECPSMFYMSFYVNTVYK